MVKLSVLRKAFWGLGQMCINILLLKGMSHVMETNFFRNDDFAVFLIGQITEIFYYFSQNEGVILKMNS